MEGGKIGSPCGERAGGLFWRRLRNPILAWNQTDTFPKNIMSCLLKPVWSCSLINFSFWSLNCASSWIVFFFLASFSAIFFCRECGRCRRSGSFRLYKCRFARGWSIDIYIIFCRFEKLKQQRLFCGRSFNCTLILLVGIIKGVIAAAAAANGMTERCLFNKFESIALERLKHNDCSSPLCSNLIPLYRHKQCSCS